MVLTENHKHYLQDWFTHQIMAGIPLNNGQTVQLVKTALSDLARILKISLARNLSIGEVRDRLNNYRANLSPKLARHEKVLKQLDAALKVLQEPSLMGVSHVQRLAFYSVLHESVQASRSSLSEVIRDNFLINCQQLNQTWQRFKYDPLVFRPVPYKSRFLYGFFKEIIQSIKILPYSEHNLLEFFDMTLASINRLGTPQVEKLSVQYFFEQTRDQLLKDWHQEAGEKHAHHLSKSHSLYPIAWLSVLHSQLSRDPNNPHIEDFTRLLSELKRQARGEHGVSKRFLKRNQIRQRLIYHDMPLFELCPDPHGPVDLAALQHIYHLLFDSSAPIDAHIDPAIQLLAKGYVRRHLIELLLCRVQDYDFNHLRAATVLQCALKARHFSNTVGVLVAVGYNINAQDLNGRTLLMSWLLSPRSSAPVSWVAELNTLLALGANLSLQDNKGATLIHRLMCLKRPNFDGLAEMVIKKASLLTLNSHNHRGHTALFYALHNRRVKPVQWLLEKACELTSQASLRQQPYALLEAAFWQNNLQNWGLRLEGTTLRPVLKPAKPLLFLQARAAKRSRSDNKAPARKAQRLP